MRRQFALPMLCAVITLSAYASTRAQPVAPTVRSCTVDQIDQETLQAAATGPVPQRSDPVPTGEPVSDTDLQRISRVVRIMTGCTNANQPLRVLALVTETYLAGYFAGPDGQDQLGHLIAAASRSPQPAAPGDRLALIWVTEPVRYEDGRIGVTVVMANADGEYTDLLIFLSTEDGWRLDQVVLGEVGDP